MISFDYHCTSCGNGSDSKRMNSFVCKCGGEMVLGNCAEFIKPFVPYYSREMKTHITSLKHEDRMLRAKGFAFLHDHKLMKQEASQIRKHREEITQAEYAKIGVKYQPHSGARFDEKRGEMVGGRRNGFSRKFFSLICALCLSTSVASAKIEGVQYAEVVINGNPVHFPIGNDERKNDVFYLKKALNGDKEAREIFLGGQKERMFFIGEYEPLWLKVSESSEEIIKP